VSWDYTDDELAIIRENTVMSLGLTSITRTG
jgi:hypothetical protein